MTLAEKLLAIQSELNVPKGQENKFGGYKYRSCEDILEAVKPLLAKNKAFLRIYDEVVQIGERYYIKAVAVLGDTEQSESETIIQYMSTGYAREEESKKGMDGSQITGAASSYARKYALNGLFAIDDAKDSDATNVKKCAECKKVIEGTDKATAAQIAAASKKKFGKELCVECAQKAAKEKKDAQ